MQQVRRSVRVITQLVLGFVVALMLILAAFLPRMASSTGDGLSPKGERVAALINRYGCWTGQAPRGAEPHHAIVSYDGGAPFRAKAAIGFDIWLEPERAPDWQLHAFCP